MPVKLFRRIGVVVDVDDDLSAFFETQQRSRELPVIGSRRQEPLRADLYERGGDANRVVRGLAARGDSVIAGRQAGGEGGQPRGFDELATIHGQGSRG